ncbi:MAG: hypothetical protein A2Z34_05045 [Planctomycetes bacterium RBG_16_59_8]|nr:MAG: hypothetical protein A2Z34_05045 [Planctomycetes bacterium RBG_16_59_8]
MSAYLDGELAGEEKRLLDEHLASCASCSSILKEFRENDRLARQTLEPSSPEAVLDGMEEKVLGRIRPRRILFPMPLRIASLAAAILIGIFLLARTWEEPPPIGPAAPVATPSTPSLSAGVYRDESPLLATIGGEAIFISVANGAQEEYLPALQQEVLSNGIVGRLAEIRNGTETDPETRRRLAQMEAVFIEFSNFNAAEDLGQMETIKKMIDEYGLAEYCRAMRKE